MVAHTDVKNQLETDSLSRPAVASIPASLTHVSPTTTTLNGSCPARAGASDFTNCQSNTPLPPQELLCVQRKWLLCYCICAATARSPRAENHISALCY